MSPKLFVFLALVAVTSASIYKDCGSSATVTEVNINGCTGAPCNLVKGTDAFIQLKFQPGAAASAVNTNVHGIIGGVPIPFEVPEGKACETEHVKPGCPLVPGQDSEYNIKLPIKSIYPSLRLNIKWQLQDENGKDIVCILFPAALKSP